ncbi:MAG: hypothetical protein HY923_08850 [Elusimicrobia bacterium]|nr:hypothetical protein [Elusimicrobiota bacterium]
MKCPNCGVSSKAGAADCAGCGVIFAKFQKKLELGPGTPSKPINPWAARAVAAALVAVWFVGFGLFYRERVSEIRVRAPHGTIPRR